MSSIGSDEGRSRGYSEHKDSEDPARSRSESIESGYETAKDASSVSGMSDTPSVTTEYVINAGRFEELAGSQLPSSFVDRVLQRVTHREIDVSAGIDRMMQSFEFNQYLLEEDIKEKTPLLRKEAFSQEEQKQVDLVLVAKEQIELNFKGLKQDRKGRFQKELSDGRTLSFVKESEEKYKIIVSDGQKKMAFRLYYHRDVSFWNDHAAICLQKLESCYKAMPEEDQIVFEEEYQKTKDSIKQPSINSFSSPFISKEQKVQKEREHLLEAFISKASITIKEQEVLISVQQEGKDLAHVSIHKPLKNPLHVLIEKGKKESPICYKKEAIPYPSMEEQEPSAAEKLFLLIEREASSFLQEQEIDPESLSEDHLYPLSIDLIHRGSEKEFQELRSACQTFQSKHLWIPFFQNPEEPPRYMRVVPKITLYRSASKEVLSDRFLEAKAKNSLANAHCLMQLQERIKKKFPHPILDSLDEGHEENSKKFSLLQEIVASSTSDKQEALLALYEAKTHNSFSQEDRQAYVNAAKILLLKWQEFKDLWIQDDPESPYRIDGKIEDEIFSHVDGMEGLKEVSEEVYQKIKNHLISHILLQTLKNQDLKIMDAICLPIDENDSKDDKDKQEEILEGLRKEVERSLESFLNNQVESSAPAEEIAFSLPFEAEIAQELQEGRILEKTKDLFRTTPLEVQKRERLADFCVRGLEDALDKRTRSLEELAKPIVESRLAIYQRKRKELYQALNAMNTETPEYKTLFAYLNLLEAIVQKQAPEEIAKALTKTYQALGSTPFIVSGDFRFPTLQPAEDSTGYFASITRLFS